MFAESLDFEQVVYSDLEGDCKEVFVVELKLAVGSHVVVLQN
jgi:hypothetical protein